MGTPPPLLRPLLPCIFRFVMFGFQISLAGPIPPALIPANPAANTGLNEYSRRPLEMTQKGPEAKIEQNKKSVRSAFRNVHVWTVWGRLQFPDVGAA